MSLGRPSPSAAACRSRRLRLRLRLPAAARIDPSEKHRSPTRNTPQTARISRHGREGISYPSQSSALPVRVVAFDDRFALRVELPDDIDATLTRALIGLRKSELAAVRIPRGIVVDLAVGYGGELCHRSVHGAHQENRLQAPLRTPKSRNGEQAAVGRPGGVPIDHVRVVAL